jgi:arylsulfatase
MNRSATRFGKTKIPACFVMALVLFAETGLSQTGTGRPNVILFFLDDSGYGDYAHTGNPTIQTPQISKLARDGVSFTQFYVASPACSASRYALMTGRHPARSGLGSWVIGPNARRYLHPDEVTLAEGLRQRGYKTGLFGKWHLGTPNEQNGFTPQALPLAHGFDVWLGTNVSHDYPEAMLLESDPKGNTPVRGYSRLADALPFNPPLCASLTGRYVDAAIAFIKKNRETPFFAYVAFNMPHLGIHASERFRGRSRRGLLGDVMEEIDDGVGRIREALEAAGLSRNTLIIFSSDNGPWIRFQETAHHPRYGEARMHVGYALPFRDGKGSSWEGGFRVPGIFCWPGTISSNTVRQEPASTLDVLPTVFALAGVPLPADRSLDGRDIRSYLMPAEQPGRAVQPFTFFYAAADNTPFAVRMGPWKMLTRIFSQTKETHGFSASRENPLLFQVEQDIGERINRADEQTGIINDMKHQLTTFESRLSQEGPFWKE